MEPSSVLLYRRSNPLTPYKPDAWLRQLSESSLLKKYPDLYHSLIHGFNVGIPSIQQTYIPPNNPSIVKYQKSFRKEDTSGRSHRTNSRPSLAPSNLHPFPWFPNQANQGNFVLSTISHTLTHQAKTLYLVFKGPVHRTKKKTEIGLNQTDWDRTSGLFLDQSFAAWLLVFHFKKYCGTAKRPV